MRKCILSYASLVHFLLIAYDNYSKSSFWMPRVTLALGDQDHLALKLLSLRKNKKVLALLHEAVVQYLEREGGYKLKIQSDESYD